MEENKVVFRQELKGEAEAKSAEAEQKVRQVGLAQGLDEISPTDIIDEAKLYGWTTPHPDVGDLGHNDMPFDSLVDPDVVKRLFTQSQVHRNKGWNCEMLDWRLTEDEGASYQKLYRLSIPDDSNPHIPTNPPEDTVQAMYADSDEALVSFDPEVLEWYPSVMIPLPQQELFEHLLGELVAELGKTTEDEVIRVAGTVDDDGSRIWTEPSAVSDARVATCATEAQRRLTLDVPLPDEPTSKGEVKDWLQQYRIL